MVALKRLQKLTNIVVSACCQKVWTFRDANRVNYQIISLELFILMDLITCLSMKIIVCNRTFILRRFTYEMWLDARFVCELNLNSI